MAHYEIGFVDNNGNPLPDGLTVTFYVNDNSFTVIESSVIGTPPATSGQGSAYFQTLNPGVIYKVGYSSIITGTRLLTLPATPTIVVPVGVDGPVGPPGNAGPRGQGFTYQGGWNSVTSYNPYDVVTYLGTSYVCTTANSNTAPPASGWGILSTIGATGPQGNTGATGAAGANGTGFLWRGTYSISTTYAIGDCVQYNNSSYISILANNTNNLPTSGTGWNLVAAAGVAGANGTSINWRGSWLSTNTYAINDAVTNGGSSYIAIATSTNQAPPNGAYWNVLAQAGSNGTPGTNGTNGTNGTSFTWRGAWVSATAYNANDVVVVSGTSYMCILANSAHTPPNATYWTVMAQAGTNGATGATGATGTSFTWKSAWSSTTAYSVNQAVSYNGSAYMCILGNTNQVPTNTTYWSLMAAQGTTGATGGTGSPGATGASGHGSTTTTSSVTSSGSGASVSVAITDGTAFPNLSFLCLTDGTHVLFGQITAGGTTTSLTVTVLYPVASVTVSSGAVCTFGGPLVNSFNFYDISGQFNGTIPASTIVQKVIAPRSFKLISGGANYATSGTLATASTTFTIFKNGSSIGTIVYTNASLTGTVSITTTTTFAAGDILTVIAPGTADSTLANIAYTLGGAVL